MHKNTPLKYDKVAYLCQTKVRGLSDERPAYSFLIRSTTS